MKTDTSQKIIDYLRQKGQATAKELVDYLAISRQALFKHHLGKLLEEEKIIKIGKPPKVFYLIKEKSILKKEKVNLNNNIKKIIRTK